MIEVVKIQTMEEVEKLAFQQEYSEDIDRLRSRYLYRGLQNKKYKLVTSLQRNCGEKSKELEPLLLRNFAKYMNIIDPSIDQSDWRTMIIGQHHSLPTRLMDWTISVPMALNFATDESDLDKMDDHDCAIWRINVDELNKFLPENYQSAMTEKTCAFTLKELERMNISIDTYDADMGNKAFITLDPPSIDERIVNQFSYFTIMPDGITDLEEFLETQPVEAKKYIIDKNLRWGIRDILDQWNINERTVYPGVDGIAEWMKRYYYVKNKKVTYTDASKFGTSI